MPEENPNITMLLKDWSGGKAEDLALEEARVVTSKERSPDLVALDDALNRLAKFDERQAKVVELRYFSGFTIEETAEILRVSNATVGANKLWRRLGFTRKLVSEFFLGLCSEFRPYGRHLLFRNGEFVYSKDSNAFSNRPVE